MRVEDVIIRLASLNETGIKVGFWPMLWPFYGFERPQNQQKVYSQQTLIDKEHIPIYIKGLE